jgi:hypothetical protein
MQNTPAAPFAVIGGGKREIGQKNALGPGPAGPGIFREKMVVRICVCTVCMDRGLGPILLNQHGWSGPTRHVG